MKQYFAVGLMMAVVATPSAVMAQGNLKIESFHHAKRTLETEVYFDHRENFYCRARFDARKNITLPEGFVTPQHQKRAHRVSGSMWFQRKISAGLLLSSEREIPLA